MNSREDCGCKHDGAKWLSFCAPHEKEYAEFRAKLSLERKEGFIIHTFFKNGVKYQSPPVIVRNGVEIPYDGKIEAPPVSVSEEPNEPEDIIGSVV